ncbi:MAG: DUF1464 family protein [Ignisphaera sp.]|nr:DUF1464 family protein [Ignisphaera sp.]MDW8085832.1 DUF1464 family protein [Ignisphaera sp.]
MVRIVGVDPGTKTFDAIVLEDGLVRSEQSFDTFSIAKEPQILIDGVDRLEPDYVVAPSGYGVPITFGDNIRDSRRFAAEVILLSTEDVIRVGAEAGEVGIWVYDAIVKTLSHLIDRYRERVVFLPAVIHLPTVPRYRKVNKVDMGTVDKLASAFLAVHEISERRGEDYGRVNIIVTELGYGYAASMAVERGAVVDGVGGSYASIGTLTAGALDLEVVVGAGVWSRWDVFYGGVFYGAKAFDMEAVARGYEAGEEPYVSMFNAFIEGVAKDIARMRISSPKADTVVLTGRHSRVDLIVKRLREVLRDVDITTLRGLKGASKAKEAAQGYTAIGDGVFGGYFKDLVKHMGIEGACGTSADYIIHPRAQEFAARIRRAYVESVYRPRLCRE